MAANALPFLDQVILITGAGSGIGRATSHRLAILGATLALADIQLASVTEVGTQCVVHQPSRSHSVYAVDVSDPVAVNAVVAAVVAHHGRLDHVFNCAGINPTPTSIVATTDEYWQRLVGVNLQGTFNVCRASIPHLQPGASVTNVSSIVGVRPPADMAAYAATKAGIIGFSKAMAIELGPQGIRCNVVVPGDIHTATNASVVAGDVSLKRAIARVALGRLGSPDEVAGVVVFLLQSSFVNGSVVEVNGGVQ